MRKLVLAIALVAGFASCEKQAAIVDTGTLQLKTTVEETTIGKKGGIVSDAGIPIYVKGVDVTVTGPGGAVVTDNFMYSATGTDPMVVDNVALGMNTVDATSIAITNALPHTFIESNLTEWDAWFWLPASWESDYVSANDWYLALGLGEVNAADMSSFIAGIIGYERDQTTGAPIYALYTGSGSGQVTNPVGLPIDVLMTTNNGRQMVTFMVSNLDMLDLYDIEIMGDCPTSPMEDDGWLQLDSNTPFAVSYWSNEAAVDAANTHYTINFREHGGDGTILRTDELDIAVQSGISLWSNVVINETAFFVDDQPLSITYVPLTEEDEVIPID